MAFLGRILALLIFTPLLMLALVITTYTMAEDIYVYSSTHTLLNDMHSNETRAPVLWTAANNQVALIAGRIEADRMSNPMLLAAGGPYSCVSLHIKVEEYARGRNSSRSWKSRSNQTVVATNPHIGEYAIDQKFLRLRTLEQEPQIFGRDSSFGRLCPKTDNDCRIRVWCLQPQDITVMGDLENGQINYPSFLNKEHPLAQLGLQPPAKFATLFEGNFKTYNMGMFFFAGIAYLLLMLRGGKRAYVVIGLLVLFTLATLIPYRILAQTELAYAVTILFLFAGIYLIFTIFGHTPATKPEPVLNQARTIPGYGSANTASLNASAATHTDLIATALDELKLRLSPLTVTALSPQQLDKSIAGHVERMAPERWDRMDEAERAYVTGKIATALKSIR